MIVNSSKMQEKHQHGEIRNPNQGGEIQIRKQGVSVKSNRDLVLLSNIKEEAEADTSCD